MWVRLKEDGSAFYTFKNLGESPSEPDCYIAEVINPLGTIHPIGANTWPPKVLCKYLEPYEIVAYKLKGLL